MKIIFNKQRLLQFIHNEKNLGFVPTMGAIHDGHKSLIKKAIKETDKIIVSIFVNKPQFNKSSDYKKYPRSINKDISILKKLDVDYLYIPKAKEIYPDGVNNKIKVNKFSKQLCGKFRKGHFEAIADVVDRFIKIINPKRIYFGEKDMQQLKLIEDFAKKNHKKVKVIACKTIREKNGIAYSSRNLLLTSNEKNKASKIYHFIKKNKYKLINKKISIKSLKKEFFKIGIKKIEYIEIKDINKIIKPYKKKHNFKIFVAYYLNNIRLIDNV